MTTQQAGSKAIPSDDAAERGNSGEGKDPGRDNRRTDSEDETAARGGATGSKEEKDARAFDHPGKAGERP